MSKLIQEQIDVMLSSAIELAKSRYARWIEPAQEAWQESKGYKMPSNIVAGIARALYNMESHFAEKGHNVWKYLKEDITTPSDIGAFINYAFDIVSSILPASPIEEFATTQVMDKRVGEVFYMDILIGKSKGSYAEGDSYLDSKTGPRTGKNYSDEIVDAESLGVGTGASQVVTGTLSWGPIKPGHVRIQAAGFSADVIDNGAGILKYEGGADVGTINYSTRAFSMTVTATDDAPIVAAYEYDSTKSTENWPEHSGIPSVTMRLQSEIVTAMRRALKQRWLLDDVQILMKDHGKDIVTELQDAVIAGVMNEIAIDVAADIYSVANAGNEVIFYTVPPNTSIPYILHRQEILKTTTAASLNIKKAVQKVEPNFIISGRDMVEVCEGLPTDVYTPVEYNGEPPVGMHVVGTLRKRFKIIQNFDFSDELFLVGAKGKSWLTTGYIYCPYIPLTTTPVYMDEDLNNYRGLFTWYGKKAVNSKFYNRGKIVHTQEP